MRTPIAVSIAGSDSSGIAGIQADVKTFSALAVYGASIVTAVTAQNTQGVTAIHHVPADIVAQQIDAVFSDLDVGAVKIGMLGHVATIEAVADALARHNAKNIVLDPVMISTTGERLIDDDGLEALRRELIPRALIVTPNLLEAAVLADTEFARSEQDMEAQARCILSLGAHNVLIKGGHGEGEESVDLLVRPEEEVLRLSARRITGETARGTGCTLSSAIAAGLAKRLDLITAVHAAKAYITAAIAGAYQLKVGHGRGPLKHFYQQWRVS
jgi:hydroxymethylpyrimidine/phosphomethylpyrimidine kinase